MFDIGWTEMLVIAVVMIVVVGPKDLPKMLRTFGRTTAKLRLMAGDFQKQFNEALREAELEDVKKSVDQLRSLNPTNEIRKHVNPFQKAADDVRAGLQSLNPAVARPDATPVPMAPLKTGAAGLPGEAATLPEPASEVSSRTGAAVPPIPSVVENTAVLGTPPADLGARLDPAAPAAPAVVQPVVQPAESRP